MNAKEKTPITPINVDYLFKGIVCGLLGLVVFFCKRGVESFDKTVDKVGSLEETVATMKGQMLEMNKNWERVFQIENAKQKQHDDERFEDSVKK